MTSVPKYAAMEIERRWLVHLTAAEYGQLAKLPGAATSKRRYLVAGGGLDIYERPRAGLAIFEMEFGDEEAGRRYQPPHFVAREITGESSFSGIALSEARAA